MFDSAFFAFCAVAALLVLSPGATWAVVADASIDGGLAAGLWTVAGVGSANGSLAVAAAFGMSALLRRFPQVLNAIAGIGVVYLAWLGVRALMRALKGPGPSRTSDRVVAQGFRPVKQGSASAPMRFGRGLLTNYSNPSVVLFYAIVVPQFITPRDSYLPRYLLLGGTHVAMSVIWQGTLAISVGVFAEHMTRPAVRRGLDLVMGLALIAFAIKIAVAV